MLALRMLPTGLIPLGTGLLLLMAGKKIRLTALVEVGVGGAIVFVLLVFALLNARGGDG